MYALYRQGQIPNGFVDIASMAVSSFLVCDQCVTE